MEQVWFPLPVLPQLSTGPRPPVYKGSEAVPVKATPAIACNVVVPEVALLKITWPSAEPAVPSVNEAVGDMVCAVVNVLPCFSVATVSAAVSAGMVSVNAPFVCAAVLRVKALAELELYMISVPVVVDATPRVVAAFWKVFAPLKVFASFKVAMVSAAPSAGMVSA